MDNVGAISDICLLVEDLEGAIDFYRDRVGFKLRRLAPGFADFFTAGVTLALWQVSHMQTHLHLPAGPVARGGWRTMAAIQVADKAAVHAMHDTLAAQGVPFVVAPQGYPWNAYACYFTDPESNLWEIYTWQEGGHAHLLFDGEAAQMSKTQLITKAYSAFNQRDVDGALALMLDHVSWPKASEGGRAEGKEEIRAYWGRQWQEFDPHVEPVELLERNGHAVHVKVHQVVKSLAGEVLSDSEVWHVFTVEDGLIARMDVQGSSTSAASEEKDAPSTAFAKH